MMTQEFRDHLIEVRDDRIWELASDQDWISDEAAKAVMDEFRAVMGREMTDDDWDDMMQ